MIDQEHIVLPLLAQLILKEAYKEAVKEKPESLMRAKTIDAAIRRVRRAFPELFKDLCGCQ